MLLLKNYLKICKFCNKILKNKGTNLITVSIPFLSLLKEFSINITQHKKIFHDNLDFFFHASLKKDILANIILIFLKFFFLKRKDYYTDNFFKKKKFIIFSHLIDEKYLKAKKDFSFGDSIKQLSKKNCSIVYLNHMKPNNKIINEKLIKKFPLPVYILNFDINLFELLNIVKLCMKERKRLLSLIDKSSSILEKK